MPKFLSLADSLGIAPPSEGVVPLEDIRDSKAFALAVLESREFRQYIINGLVLGELPSAIITRLMDYAWGKPPERVEHTGKDGQPIQTVTEVRRVIIRVDAVEPEEERPELTYTKH